MAPPLPVVGVAPLVLVPAAGVVEVAEVVAGLVDDAALVVVVPPPVVAPAEDELDELDELVVELLEVGTALAAEVGTVNGGAPDVLAVFVPPPPQAARPAARANVAAAVAVNRRGLRRRRADIPTERREPGAPSAYRSMGSR